MATQSWNGIASYSNTKLFLNLTADIHRNDATSASVSISGEIYSGTGSGISGDSGGIRLVKFHSNVGTFNVGFYNCLDNYTSTHSLSIYQSTIDGIATSSTISCPSNVNVITGHFTIEKFRSSDLNSVQWNGSRSTSTGNQDKILEDKSFEIGYGDTTAPTIHRVDISDITPSSYAVFAYATDNIGIARIQSATWTSAGGTDDQAWVNMGSGSWNRNGQAYNYAVTINRSDHNNEYGIYKNHIYAWDSANNQSNLKAININYSPTVSFNANDGSTPSTQSKTVNWGSTYGTLPTSSRAGYDLAGWFTAASGGTQKTESSVVDSSFYNSGGTYIANHTLYAHWNPHVYTITFNPNATGATVSPTTKQVTYLQTFGTLPTPTRTGYTFTGWYDSSDVRVTSSTQYTYTSNIILYARWEANEYSIVFDNNDDYGSTTASGTMNPITCTYDQSATLPQNNFTRPGYTFTGWGTSPGKNNTKVYDDQDTVINLTSNPNDTFTLYACWTAKNYILNMDENNETGHINSKTVTFDEPYGEFVTDIYRLGCELYGYTHNKQSIVVFFETNPIEEIQDDIVLPTDIYTTVGNSTIYALWNISYEDEWIAVSATDKDVSTRTRTYTYDSTEVIKLEGQIVNQTSYDDNSSFNDYIYTSLEGNVLSIKNIISINTGNIDSAKTLSRKFQIVDLENDEVLGEQVMNIDYWQPVTLYSDSITINIVLDETILASGNISFGCKIVHDVGEDTSDNAIIFNGSSVSSQSSAQCQEVDICFGSNSKKQWKRVIS